MPPARPAATPSAASTSEAADRELRQHEHGDERPVGMLGLELVIIRRSHVPRSDQVARPEEVVGRVYRGIGRGRQEVPRLGPGDDLGVVHHADADRLMRAGLDARRCLADR